MAGTLPPDTPVCMKRLVPLASLVLLAACASTSEEPPGFQSGDFSVTTLSATDMCTGGAFETVFMPTGDSQEWASSWELPGEADIPWVHTEDFPDPFGEAQLTFELGDQGEGWYTALGGAPPTAVEIDPANAPGCFVDGTFDTYLQIIDSNALTGSTILHLESLDEATCPVAETELCDVKLDLRLQRI